MNLLNLANEILLIIAENLSPRDLYSLMQYNRHLSTLLQSTLDKHALGKHSMNALYWAAANGNEPMVKQLLEKGTGIIVIGDDNEILFQTPDKPSNSVVRFVLEKAANLYLGVPKSKEDLRSRTRRLSALHWAAHYEKENLVRRLMEKGADVLGETNSRRIALHRVAIKGNKTIAKLLLKNNPIAQLESTFGRRKSPVLRLAVLRGHEGVVEILLENGANISPPGYSQTPLLHIAVINMSIAITKLLLDYGADPNTRDCYDTTLLCRALHQRCEDIATLLIEKGANIRSMERSGRQLLYEAEIHEAARFCSEAMGKLLLEKGADINSDDSQGSKPLHIAASAGNQAMIKLFLENGADINSVDKRGNSALHLAVSNCHENLVKFLIENGAYIHSHNHVNQTPLSLANSLPETTSAKNCRLIIAGGSYSDIASEIPG